jgi:ketosteroid isomerase-like protein
MLDLAARFLAAVTAGDVAAVRAMYAPDAAIWHNHDGVTQGVEQNLAVLTWIAKNVTNFRYEEARLQPTPTGFVEQHVTRGRAPNGAEIAIAACIVCTVVDGRITRVDEYLDSAQMAPLLA